jgi:hypothetical protein
MVTREVANQIAVEKLAEFRRWMEENARLQAGDTPPGNVVSRVKLHQVEFWGGALFDVAAEATAAFKARVRAQAVRSGSVPKCRLCRGEWLWADSEHHVPVDGHPCAAEVEP